MTTLGSITTLNDNKDYKNATLTLLDNLKTFKTILGGSLGLIILSTIVDSIFSSFFSNLQPFLRHLPAFVIFLCGIWWLFFLYRYIEKEHKRIKKIYLNEG